MANNITQESKIKYHWILLHQTIVPQMSTITPNEEMTTWLISVLANYKADTVLP